MQSVSLSNDDVRKRLLEKPRFELAAKGVLYSDWEDVTSSGRAFQVFGPATAKARLPSTDCWSLDRWHLKTTGACRTKRLFAGRLRAGTSDPGTAVHYREELLMSAGRY